MNREAPTPIASPPRPVRRAIPSVAMGYLPDRVRALLAENESTYINANSDRPKRGKQ